MDDYNYKPEKDLENAPESISSAILKIILEQMDKSICKIKCNEGGNATGFFCIIPYPDKFHQLPVLMTNYHVINEEDKKIVFTLNNDKLKYEIEINNNRKIYYSHIYDITIIEIKNSDKLIMNSFLELDDNIFKDNPNDIYRNISIYLIGFPNGGISKYSMGIFKLIEEDDFTIRHLCRSNPGSSGCPILNLNNSRVIGIHKGSSDKRNWNLGTFIQKPLEEFNKIKFKESEKITDKEDNILEENKEDNRYKKVLSSNFLLNKDDKDKEDNNYIEVIDKLDFQNNPNVKAKIGDEEVYYSDKIIKNNSQSNLFDTFFSKNQQKILAITDLAVYHFKGTEIERRIIIDDLKAITISTFSNQFILHCNQNEYDILYKYENRKILIKILNNLYQRKTGKTLLFCKKYEKDLLKYVVTCKERRKNPYLYKIEHTELSSIEDYLESNIN